MKLLLTVSFLFLSTVLFAKPAESIWTDDYPAAVKQAKAQKKDLLVFFTGSDWCPYCISLGEEVLEKDLFITEAPKKFVLFVADFPREIEQSDALKEQNMALRKKYKPNGFPTLFLASNEEKPYIQTGYTHASVEDYVKWLGQAQNIKGIDQLMTVQKWDDALKSIKTFVDSKPFPDLAQHVLIARAMIFEKQGKSKEEIIQALEDAIAADPEAERSKRLAEAVEKLKAG